MIKGHKFGLLILFTRIIWQITWFFFTLPFPRKSGNTLKIILLKFFGAKVSFKSTVYSSAKIYMPWNLYMDDFSCIGPDVNIYNVDKIILKSNVVISQNAYLCTASHNINSLKNELVTKPIFIHAYAWVGTEAYIGPGVTILEGAVVGARACVFKNIDEWNVVGGNPAKFIKKRNLNE